MDALDVITPEKLISLAEDKGKSFKSIKTNQIRNFFSAVISIKNKVQMMGIYFKENEVKSDLLFLKPKIAYAAGRQPKTVKPFKEFIDETIDAWMKAADKRKATKNFFILIEGIIAYHKFHGGD